MHDNYIPYAICKTDSRILSEKAYHPDEIMGNNGEMSVMVRIGGGFGVV